MLRTISKLPEINKKVKLVHFLRFCSNINKTSIEKNESKSIQSSNEERDEGLTFLSKLNQSIKLNELASENEESIKIESIDDLIKRLDQIRDIETILETIKPFINQLESVHLEAIYSRINFIGFRKLFSSYLPNFYMPIRSFARTVKESNIFKLLTDTMIKRLLNDDRSISTKCILDMFQTLILSSHNPNKLAFDIVIKSIYHRINELSIDEILSFLVIFDNYVRRTVFSSNAYSNYSKTFYGMARIIILKNDFDIKDVNLMIKSFKAFIPNFDENVLNHLIHLLNLPSNQLNYHQSIRLLNNIQRSKEQNFNKFKNLLNSDQLNCLIDKCNRTINAHLQSNPDKLDDQLFYISKFGKTIEKKPLILGKLYEITVLQKLIPSIVESKKSYSQIYNLFVNYFNYDLIDERLIKHINDLILNNDKFRRRFGITCFLKLTKFRLPFIDHQQLIGLLLDNNYPQIHRLITNSSLDIKFELLCAFILGDIKNADKLLIILDKIKDQLDDTSIRRIDDDLFQKLIISRIYFNLFNQLNKNFKIETKFDALLMEISEIYNKPQVRNQFLDKDKKLKLNAFLSNGLFLNNFAIYDQSENDLIPLHNQSDYFFKIDEITLKKHQYL